MPHNWVEFPFAPKRWPFFYGWTILGICIVGTVASIPGQTMGVGVFTDSLAIVLQLSAFHLSIAYAISTIASSFALPYGGLLIDRYGIRTLGVTAALGLAVSVLILSGIDRLPGVAGNIPAGLAVIMVCFFAMRFFGQGMLTMVPRVAIGKWFDLRRGLASGIIGIFTAFAFNGSMVALNALVQTVGWREAYLILAAIVGLGVGFLSWLLYRDNPEECGLEPDGELDETSRTRMQARESVIYKEFSRAEAVRTLSFWAFTLGPSVNALMSTALFFHLAALGAESGLTRDRAYLIFIPMPFISVPVNFVSGIISDRIRLKWLLTIMALTQLQGLCGLIFFHHLWGQVLLVSGFGISGGLFGTIINVTFPRYFGRIHLGALTGLNMSVTVFASALGPVLFSAGEWLTGRFQPVVIFCLIMPVLVFILSFFATNPQEKYAPLK